MDKAKDLHKRNTRHRFYGGYYERYSKTGITSFTWEIGVEFTVLRIQIAMEDFVMLQE